MEIIGSEEYSHAASLKKLGIDIFACKTLEDFLSSYAEARKTQRKSWTFGVWAKSLNLANTAAITRVVNGDRTPGDRLTESLIKYFNFSILEKQYFEYLILKQKAKSDKYIDRLVHKMTWPLLNFYGDYKLKTNTFKEIISKPFLQLKNGQITSLVGTTDFGKVSEFLKPLGLEPIQFCSSAYTMLDIAHYPTTTAGKYYQFHLGIISKPIGESDSETGIWIGFPHSNSLVIKFLGRLLWGNQYERASFLFGKEEASRKRYEFSQENEEILSYGVGESSMPFTEMGQPFSIWGFSEAFGKLSRFKLDLSANGTERLFDPEVDEFICKKNKLNDFLVQIDFLPLKWMFFTDVTAGISAPVRFNQNEAEN